MGKSSKKSATKVESAVVAAAPTKPLAKGKREAEIPSKKDVVKKQKVEERKIINKKAESSSEEEDSSDSEELPKANLPTKNGKVESESEDDSGVEEESSSDEEVVPTKKAAPAKKVAAAKKKDSSDDESDESEEESSSDEEEKAPAAAAKPKAPAAKKDESSDEADDSEEESESDDEAAKPVGPVTKAATKEKKAESDDESGEEESSGDEETSDEEETPAKTKTSTDVKMTDAEKTPKTPSAPKEQGTGSKTLFVGNLSFSVEEADVQNFFKPAGEVIDVRFAMKDDAFRGFGHVEFSTPAEAEKALNELNGKDLCGRAVRLDLAREKGAYTPGGNETQSYQKGGKSDGGKTVFVKGFDKYKGEDEIRNALQEHFGSCGEMNRCSIPTDRETGDVKGMAYIEFADSAAFSKALELDGSEFGDRSLVVNEATPRDNSGGGGFGGRSGGGGYSGGRSSGGRFGRGDRDSGRGRGRGRGRDSGGRGRGRDGGRGYSKPSFGGKKTTFE